MKKNIKAKWLKALRSGEYKQGRKELRTCEVGGDRFCCLGVLTDLYKKDKEISWEEATGNNPGTLNESVAEWAGIDIEKLGNVVNIKRSKFSCLSEMNDKGRSFKQIANVIDNNL